jgi:dihydroxyacid dehydratase/phosphogluconate dehydratase
MTREAIENAIRLTLAIRGSTNLILHIPALAHLLGHPLDLDCGTN